MGMKKHLTTRSWCYVVPPDNIKHVIISHHSSGAKLYYVSVEEWDGSKWNHVKGLGRGGFINWNEAFRLASEIWTNLAGKKLTQPANA